MVTSVEVEGGEVITEPQWLVEWYERRRRWLYLGPVREDRMRMYWTGCSYWCQEDWEERTGGY